MLYPLFFTPIYQEKVWGGTPLRELYDGVLPPIEIEGNRLNYSHKQVVNIITNGDFRGTTLGELFETQAEELLGKAFSKLEKPKVWYLFDPNLWETLCLWDRVNPYLVVEKIQLEGEIHKDTKSLKFYLYTCIEGQGIIEHNEIEYKFCKGQSFMIPGSTGKYLLAGHATLLQSYIPRQDQKDIQNK